MAEPRAARRRGKGAEARGVIRAAAPEGATLTVHVPFTFRRHRGRKTLVTPNGVAAIPTMTSRATENAAIVRALARAFRWRKLIETGVYATVQEIATAERINSSYVSRVLRLTLLAPDLVEGFLHRRGGEERALDRFAKRFPVDWPAQRRWFDSRSNAALRCS